MAKIRAHAVAAFTYCGIGNTKAVERVLLRNHVARVDFDIDFDIDEVSVETPRQRRCEL